MKKIMTVYVSHLFYPLPENHLLTILLDLSAFDLKEKNNLYNSFPTTLKHQYFQTV